MTETKSFGTSKREGHDSSKFYRRKIFERLEECGDQNKRIETIEKGEEQEGGEWWNKIYNQSSERMNQVPDNSIGLAFTSPPYNVGKEYEGDLSLSSYLDLIAKVGREVYRTLVPGGRYLINIANIGRKPYVPYTMHFHMLHSIMGFKPVGEIIWVKSEGSNGNCAWGSWMSAKAPTLRDVHEYILCFTKESFGRPDTKTSTISRNDFMESTISHWKIPAEKAKRTGHPAPFPVELPERAINLFSYQEDIILDPFIGSGTTAIAAQKKSRKYVGYEVKEEYVQLAQKRIKKATAIY